MRKNAENPKSVDFQGFFGGARFGAMAGSDSLRIHQNQKSACNQALFHFRPRKNHEFYPANPANICLTCPYSSAKCSIKLS